MYLTELISPYVPRRALRSADQLLLEQPTQKLKLIGLRACTATQMIPTIEMIPATEMTPNHHRNDPHHRNDNYSQWK